MSRDGVLGGQVALVTGASRGIGLAIASRLARMGARVAVCARGEKQLRQAAEGLRAEGLQVVEIVADVSRSDEVTALVHHTRQTTGPIDILVNNAGIGVFAPFHELDESQWDKVLGANLKSAFLVSRAVVPEMIQRKTGHIIHISSLAGKNTFANGSIYCASKWGLQGLAGCMAEDLRGYGIRVSTICPGSVATNFAGQSSKDPATLPRPEDVAHVVAALVTQEPNSFISEVQMRPTRKPQTSAVR